jgi:hypothetical protein
MEPEMTKYNAENFFNHTAAVFTTCDEPEREPDYISGLDGSKYWYTDDGVIRTSDHWGYGIASCNWWLRELDMIHHGSVGFDGLLDAFGKSTVCAYCPFDGFHDADELYKEYEQVKKSISFKVNQLF